MKKLTVLIFISIFVVASIASAYGLQMLRPQGAPPMSASTTAEKTSVEVKPSCVPITCQQASRVCGSMSNGCHGTVECGSCPAGLACNSTGQCISISAADKSPASGGGGSYCTPDCSGKQCGGDGCGGSCGTCAAGKACGSDGVCFACTMATCSSLGKGCGPWADGCGGLLDCGTCDADYACRSGDCAYIGNPTTTLEVGDLWWTSIFKGDWSTLFNYTVDASNSTLPAECQNNIRSTYASFVGAAYSLSIENATTPCSQAANPLPTGCVYSSYSLNTSTIFGSFTGLLYFVDVDGKWRSQADCRWYA